MRRGAPYGNNNGGKGKWWESALKRALSRGGGSIQLGLAPIADKLVAAAQAGDMDAIREIACRLDGKPKESVEVTAHHIVDDRRISETRQTLRAKASERMQLQ